MRYCDTCHRRHWVAKIDKNTGLQVKHRNGNKLFRCIKCGNVQEEEQVKLESPDKIAAGILYIDIEVSKSLVYSYGRRVLGEYLNPDDLVKEQFIICWAASYVGQSTIWSECVTAKDAKNFDDRKIIKRIHELISAADIIGGHNINQFDMKHLNTRFLKYKLPPITNKKTIDTLLIARSKFKLFSNTLDFIEKWLGYQGKDHIVNNDWLQVLEGNQKTIDKVLKYNKGDVKHGKEVLQELLPWAGKKATYGAITGVQMVDLKKPASK